MSIRQSVKALTDPPATTASLSPAPAVGARPGGISVGRQQASQAVGGAGFDEADYAQREYWPTVNRTSTDGIFTIQERPIKSILLLSGGRATFKQPT
ncbi:MAG TPA: hypothetical protein PK620_13040 [Denitromonas sp.]|nr:hypothetical protein [Denitromonas sp.]HQV15837.1 hypothetical protein [Denitromonas sp.]